MKEKDKSRGKDRSASEGRTRTEQKQDWRLYLVLRNPSTGGGEI